nr:immunoglobulin light chain junction region [Macaca mulatta]
DYYCSSFASTSTWLF